MKLLCRAIGCRYNDCCSCKRCGTDIYDGFIEPARSWCGWYFRSAWWLERNRWKISHPCAVCKKRMVWSDDHCCSDGCYENWELPF